MTGMAQEKQTTEGRCAEGITSPRSRRVHASTIRSEHAHPRHQRRRHPFGRARRLRRDRARAVRRRLGGRAGIRSVRRRRIRSRSTIRCGCARSASAVLRSRARRPIASSWARATCIKARPPNLVLSGVNRGRNAGEDVIYSGTVAGAVEGTVLGIPSFALSQAYRSRSGEPPHWETRRCASRPTSSAACSRPAFRATC